MRFSLASTVVAIGGATLLTTALISPASSAPTQTAPVVSAPAPDAMMPGLAEVNAQLDRLHGRLGTPVAATDVGRNPFEFGDRPEIRRTASAPVSIAPVIDAEPVVVAPKLVAILSDADVNTGQLVRTAVFSIGDDVVFAKDGDDVGAFKVDVVRVDDVALVERPSSRLVTLSLH